jgi:hypothetical protein
MRALEIVGPEIEILIVPTSQSAARDRRRNATMAKWAVAMVLAVPHRVVCLGGIEIVPSSGREKFTRGARHGHPVVVYSPRQVNGLTGAESR